MTQGCCMHGNVIDRRWNVPQSCYKQILAKDGFDPACSTWRVYPLVSGSSALNRRLCVSGSYFITASRQIPRPPFYFLFSSLMSLPAPTEDELTAVANELGLPITHSDLKIFHSVISQRLKRFDQLLALGEEHLERTAPARHYHWPSAAENTYGAWF